jgi:DNA polymerase-3 subunit beta
VLWEFGKKKIRLVATDGFRLAVEELQAETKADQINLLVPSRVVMEVVRLATGGNVSIGHLAATNQIYFMIGEIQVVSQLLSGNFPDYGKILPKEFSTEISISKDELLQAIKATHIFARDNSNMVKWLIEEGKLVLLSSSPERGECRVEVPVSLTGDPLEIIFNAKYVLDYLSIVEGETLWVGMGTKLSPGMIKDLKRESGQYVVMPINA